MNRFLVVIVRVIFARGDLQCCMNTYRDRIQDNYYIGSFALILLLSSYVVYAHYDLFQLLWQIL